VGVTVGGAVVVAVEVDAAVAVGAVGATGADMMAVCWDDLSVAEEQSATALHSCAMEIYRSSVKAKS